MAVRKILASLILCAAALAPFGLRAVEVPAGPDIQVADTVAVAAVAVRQAADTAAVAPALDPATEAIVRKYAARLGVSDSLIHNPVLYVIIDEWMGAPYKYGGNTKKGTDCSGFVGQIMKHFTTSTLPRSAAEMAKTVTLKPAGELQEGDLVFFSYGKKPVGHVGIYLQNGWFVHASSYRGGGVILSNLHGSTYSRRFCKCGSVQ
ncbi:MAG: C40 family peptidase [Rikenellaceae bacterium]|jgi:cell wall-associated NlpC family hydrolase|nr:C40 family peptidase [Rikenellaceae bacterium]